MYKKEQTLNNVFVSVHNSIQQEIDKNINVLYAIKANYIAHKGMSRDEFDSYAGFYANNIKSIQALEWVPKVKQANRDSFELAAHNLGMHDFQITQIVDGKLVRAKKRELYYPIYYVVPFEGNENALGFAPGNDLPTRLETINESITTGKAASSNSISLVQKSSAQKAVIVFVPIYSHEIGGNGNEVIGLVEGVYLTEGLINTALNDVGIQNTIQEYSNINMHVTEMTDTLVVYGRPSEIDVYTRTGELKLANRTWQLHLTNESALTWWDVDVWILIGTVLFTILLTKVVYDVLTNNRKQLLISIGKLASKNKELEQYAYVASHDLQEPLHTLMSLVDLLIENVSKKLNESERQYLVYIREASERMSALISNLLHYSQIGNYDGIETIDCNEVMDQLKKDLENLITGSGATIVANDLPIISGYRAAILQLFQNLISNAIKFQETTNKPIITISAIYENGVYTFKVEDNGIGIPKDKLNDVFIIFKRLHLRKKFPGTGIGLANCKKIVELHEGEIWVDSELGKGSTFKFTLGLDKQE